LGHDFFSHHLRIRQQAQKTQLGEAAEEQRGIAGGIEP